jgi:exodeoxyribonuclease V alpha subunit
MQESIDVHKIFAKYFSGCESLAYALSSKLGEGNICINIDEYKKELFLIKEEEGAKESLDEDDLLFLVSPEEFEKQCIPGKYVTYSEDELKPFVIRDRTAYLHRYFQYETQIINNIKRLGDNFYIITGGPGTGKTYSVALKLAELYRNNPGLRVALAAPTGKAGSRMNEAIKDFAGNPKNNIEQKIKDKLTGLKAHTIHVLLGYIPNSVFFRYDENNRLPYDVVIIDECSMIDGAMMAKLLNAIDTGTRLYLLGDKDQLASVEAGSVFGDMCRSKDSELMIGKVELKMKSWRFEADKGIGKFSTEVITGSFNNPENYDGDGQIIIDTSFSKELFD